MESPSVNTYQKLYSKLYALIQLICEKSNKNLIITPLTPEMPTMNLPRIQNELKKHSTAPDQLFKKFPLRAFVFIVPTTSATMKSILKYVEEKKIIIDINSNLTTTDVRTNASDEELVSNKMAIMSFFTEFIQSIGSLSKFTALNDMVAATQMEQQRIANKVYALAKECSKILSSNRSSIGKIKAITSQLDSYGTIGEKKDLLEFVVNLCKTYAGELVANLNISLDSLSSDEIIKHLKSSLTEENITLCSIIIGNLRMLQITPTEQPYLETLIELLTVLNKYVENGLDVLINNDSLIRNILRFCITFAAGVEDSREKIAMNVKEIVQLIKSSFSLDISSGTIRFNVVARDKSNKIIDILEKMIIDRKPFNISEILNDNELPMKEIRTNIYKKLEEKDIEWSDEYLLKFFNELTTGFIPITENK